MYVLYCFILYGIGEHCMCCVVRVQLYSIVRHWVHNYTLYIVCNCLGKSEQWRASRLSQWVYRSRYSTKWWWCSNCCDLESQIQKLRVTKFKWCQQTDFMRWSCFGAALFEISLHPIICYLPHLARLPVVLLWHWLHQSEAAHSHWLQLNLHVQVAPLLLGCIALMSLFIWWGGGVKFRQVSALKFDTVSYKYWTFQVHHPINILCFSVLYLFLCDFGLYISITQVLNIEAVYICINKM